MARRFGINYIIWNRQQWKAWAPERGWTAYYGVSPHTDHIHFSFNWDGAYKRTSWWSGVAVTKPLTGPTGSTTTPTPPPPAPAPVITSTGYPLLAQGATGADVVLAQKVIGVTADGRFGPVTAAALATWQTKHGLAGDQEARQRDLVEDGRPQADPGPAATRSRSTATSCSRRGSTGAAVTALQKAIGKLTVDGSYGPTHRGAGARSTRQSKGLTVTGVTDTGVWYALHGHGRPTPAPADHGRPPARASTPASP